MSDPTPPDPAARARQALQSVVCHALTAIATPAATTAAAITAALEGGMILDPLERAAAEEARAKLNEAGAEFDVATALVARRAFELDTARMGALAVLPRDVAQAIEGGLRQAARANAELMAGAANGGRRLVLPPN